MVNIFVAVFLRFCPLIRLYFKEKTWAKRSIAIKIPGYVYFQNFRFSKKFVAGGFRGRDDKFDIHFAFEASVPRYATKMSTFPNIDFMYFICILNQFSYFICYTDKNMALRDPGILT